MSRTIAVALCGALTLFAASGANAQSTTIPGEHITASATVVSVEQRSRSLTLRDEKGDLHTMKVPESITRFSELKPGDTVTATYYDTFTLRKKEPGEADIDTLRGAVTGTSGTRPGATTMAAQRRITATVAAIDMAVPSIAFTGPSEWKWSTKVQDKAGLEQVKVGDRVDIVWTEAILVSIAPPK